MEFEIEYNSQSEKLIIPEYGRNVQKLIQHVNTIEDDEKRQAFAEQVVGLMHQMNPQNKSVQEYRMRLWKHFFFIGGFDMKVTPPEGLDLSAVKAAPRPDRVEYPVKDKKFRHYGHNVKTLIAKAIAMEDGPIKEGFVETIASFMKMAYKNWNKEHYVSDEIVLADLHSMSEGKLTVAENTSLDTLAKAVKFTKRRPSNNTRNNRNNNRNNNRGRNNKRRGKRY